MKNFHKKEIKVLLKYNTNNQTYYKIFLMYNYEVKKSIDMKSGGGWWVLITKSYKLKYNMWQNNK